MRWLGIAAPWSWIRLYLRAQLGKYVPGAFWQYASRAALARFQGAPIRTTTLSLGVELLAGAATGLVVAIATASTLAAAAALVAGLAVAAFAAPRAAPFARFVSRLLRGRGPSEVELTRAGRATARAVVLCAPLWILHGVSLWLLARALFAVPASDFGFYTGVFAIAWLAGLAAVFAPGGIGVREAVLSALLAPRLGTADAIALAASSRLLFVAVDLAGGAAALALPSRAAFRRSRASYEPSSP